MAAGKYTFTIEQGSTVNFEVQYKDASNNPVDLTGYTGRMMIRSAYADNSPTTYVSLTNTLNPDGTGLNFNGSNGSTPLTSGSIGIFISATSSSALTFSEAFYDLEIVSGSTVTRLLEGKVRLSKEVTR